jgi:predicted component of type VI protein secretion system
MSTQTHQLTMRTGPTPGKTFQLAAGEILIGRDPSSPLPVADAEVSRKHARLYFQGGYYVVEDLGSTNGTFVNGRRLAGPEVLQSGDVIHLGENVSLVFEQVEFDPDATIIGTGALRPARTTPSPQPQPEPSMYAPPPAAEPSQRSRQPEPAAARWSPPPPAPAYTPPLQEPEEFEQAAPARNKTTAYIVAGCGFLPVACIAGLLVLWYIDANFLWCRVMPFLPGCP